MQGFAGGCKSRDSHGVSRPTRSWRSRARSCCRTTSPQGGKVEYHHKDLGIALAAGREYGVTLPVTALVDQMFGVQEAKRKGNWDHSALLTLVEEGSGVRAT